MTTEIQILASVGGLLLALTLIQGARNVILLGLPVAAGNQHDIAPWSGWNERLNRAIRNLIEAIVIFAPIALAVHGLGLSNDLSALGAQIFLASRIVHVVVYTVGLPWVRTVAWFAGVIGIVMVGSPLFA